MNAAPIRIRGRQLGAGLLLTALTALTGLTLAPLTLAQSPVAGQTGPALTEQIIAEESPQTTRVIGMTRFALSHPQTFSARLTTVFSRQPAAFDCVATCDHVGPLVQLEAGTGSVQLSAGYARIIGDRRRDGFFLSDVYLGFAVKGALLRTFGNTKRYHRDRTYLGAEGEFTITNFNFTVGVFRRVSDEPTDDHWMTVLGVGWGF